MVSKEEIFKQLKKIDFNPRGWGKGEVNQLPNIILPDEEIYECVNGNYEGGFALLVATDIRVLLIDQKPLKFLTIEDMRFDMISQMDYNHRLFGATISISAGDKHLSFRSYNKERLRKLIGHVQHCMAEIKKKQSSHQEGQNSHLEQINNQLQTYLMAQQQYQMQLQRMQMPGQNNTPLQMPEPPKPDNRLADYLYAQSLLAQHNSQTTEAVPETVAQKEQSPPQAMPDTSVTQPVSSASDIDDIYAAGMEEIYGKRETSNVPVVSQPSPASQSDSEQPVSIYKSQDLHPFQIAYSKLPEALRLRKFSRPALRRTRRKISTPGMAA